MLSSKRLRYIASFAIAISVSPSQIFWQSICDSNESHSLYYLLPVKRDTQLIGHLQLILHSVCRPIDLKIRSYPFAYLTINGTCDILFYCVCSSCVWLLICVTVFIQLIAAKQQCVRKLVWCTEQDESSLLFIQLKTTDVHLMTNVFNASHQLPYIIFQCLRVTAEQLSVENYPYMQSKSGQKSRSNITV